MAFLRVVAALVAVVSVAGCGGGPNERHPDLTNIEATVQVERLEEALFACENESQVLAFLRRNPVLPQACFSDYPMGDSALAALLYKNISNPVLRDFRLQLDSIFYQVPESLEKPLANAFRHLKYYYPDFKVPRVQTLVTGFMGNDLYVSDSLIVIGLDYFGGPEARFRPDVFDYQLRRYQEPYLVPAILFFLSQSYNRADPRDQTLLADMVWYGKGYEFVKYMAPDTPDSLIIGFSGRDLQRIYDSQTDIWAHLITHKLLYEAAEQKKQKYVGERPFTAEIGQDVPGGIGRWVGWRIVSLFLAENPAITLPELMKNDNARRLLEQSGYKGQVDE